MYRTQVPWPQSVPTLGNSLLSRLADNLSAADDPIAGDPAQLMVAAGMPPDPWQAELLQSEWQRALLLCSRQAGKSTVASALATFTAQYRPGSLILLMAAALRQAQELFRKVKAFYHAVPNRVAIKQESALQLELVNNSRIIALPGKEATIRGYSGVDLLVVDEAARCPDELYYSVRPMLAVSGGRLIALSTPFGRRGFFHQEWTEGSEDWHRTQITAHEVPRISAEFLADERAALGEWWFQQEYECQFKDTTDTVFAYELIREAMQGDVQPLFGGGH